MTAIPKNASQMALAAEKMLAIILAGKIHKRDSEVLAPITALMVIALVFNIFRNLNSPILTWNQMARKI